MQDTRHPERAIHDGEPMVVLANRELTPRRKVVQISCVVEGQGGAAIQQNEGASCRGYLHSLEMSIDDEDRDVEWLHPP
ncbi:uncharacterized protein CMC5_064980 [Chondromyces crocatus]|uniref:Uncharacterized protein n=1 Tax=Chondromyces crocatus TaxID=52 RepID=A0A0K1EMZ8_CHOCO|nr:uncharacterized protein CMC5_064980 [Chondromyces crocatus]